MARNGGFAADQRFRPSLGFVQRDFWTKDFGPRPPGVHFCSERGSREGHQSTQLERHGQSLMQKAMRGKDPAKPRWRLVIMIAIKPSILLEHN